MESNLDIAQNTLLERCRLNGLARSGKYSRDMEREPELE